MPIGRKDEPVRWAVVGLGHFAQSAVLPAFANAGPGAKLVAVVSDSPQKATMVRKHYGVTECGSYAELETVLREADVDAVYLAVPNHLHRELTLRIARAGVHVLCEKPMAVTSEECREMIASCVRHDVRLMTAYRLHLDRANMTVVDRIREGAIGDPRSFSSILTFQLTEGNVRTMPTERGGGPLYDIGTYCINAARYVFQDEPIAVTGLAGTRPDDDRFRSIDEQIGAVLEFPRGRLATFSVGFGACDVSVFTVVGTEGVLRLDPAYAYAEPRTLELRCRDGQTRREVFEVTDQVAAEIVYFGACVREGRGPEPAGREGLHDVMIIRAILESIRIGARVELSLEPLPRPTGGQVVERPTSEPPPAPVGVQPPTQG